MQLESVRTVASFHALRCTSPGKVPGAQSRLELTKIFGQFRGPGHTIAWRVRIIEAKDFSVQGLAGEIDA